MQVAGGLLLLLVALELLMGWGSSEPTLKDDVNVSMVPLGTPLLAGPGRDCRDDRLRRSGAPRAEKHSRSGPASSPSTSCCG